MPIPQEIDWISGVGVPAALQVGARCELRKTSIQNKTEENGQVGSTDKSLPQFRRAIKGNSEKLNIMKKQADSLSLNIEGLNQFSFSVVGKFCVKKSHFLIIVLNENSEDSQNSALNDSTGTLRSTPLGSFEFKGKSYFIVETENASENADPVLINLLTERELQIVTLAASGRSNKQIASHLHISEWTVSAHLRRIFIKLNVDSRAAMVYRCALLIERGNQPCFVSHQTPIGSGAEKFLEICNQKETCS